MLNLSWQDVARNVDPWGAMASGTLLLQCYRGLLTRLGYIALLFYWFVFISKDHFVYTQILQELLRSKTAKGGESDPDGTHWTLNIANTLVLMAYSQATTYLFPDHYWKSAAVASLFNILVLGNHIVQIWMQTRIAKLIRLNKDIWRWRAWLIDSAALQIMHSLDTHIPKNISALLWQGLYALFFFLISDNLYKYLATSLFLGVFWPSHPNVKALAQWSRRIVAFRFWFHNFCLFANPSPPNYVYTSLSDPEHIRVILLYPRFGFGKVCCRLIQGPHMRTLFYEAISYNWGNPDATEEILIDGCTKLVTKSVHEILTSYSSLFLPKLLWIDNICINQADQIEKSQQVPLMERIYRSAIFTTVFLGQAPVEDTTIPLRYDGLRPRNKDIETYFKDARLTFDLLRELHVLQDGALRGSDMSAYQLFEQLSISKSKQRQWAALLKMLQHPWFDRVWVIQEVALSADVYVRYGDEIIEWETLANGIKKLHNARHFRLWLELEHTVHLSHMRNTSSSNIVRMHKFREQYRPRNWNEYSGYNFNSFNLSKVLAESVYFKATNPRDLIFGLMALCENPLQVDYILSVEDVFLNAAKRLIDDRAVHTVLHNSGVGNRLATTPSLPSWVPDWRNTPKYDRLMNAVSWQQSEFKAGGEVTAAIIIKQGKFLSLSGYFIDTISVLGTALFDTSSQGPTGSVDETRLLAKNYNTCLELLSSNLPGYTYAHTPPDSSFLGSALDQYIREAFHRTLFLDTKWVNWFRSPAQFLRLIDQWEIDQSDFDDPMTSTARVDMGKDDVYRVLKRMDEVTDVVKTRCGGRRLFITQKGYIGLCPPYSREGDMVYVAHGVHVPFVLREADMLLSFSDNARRVQLVGECYVHGLMDGEALALGLAREDLEIV